MTNRRTTLILCVATGALAACGSSAGPGASEELPRIPTTSVAPLPAPATTLPERAPADAFEPVDITTITLAPPGKYPVIDPEESKRSDLEPGTYRVRLEHQADWPEQCLDELVVFPSPPEGEDLPDEFKSATDPVLKPGWEESARAVVDRVRELREPICAEHWAKWEQSWPDDEPSPEPQRPQPTTTLAE
jgi:hypothetical protein